MSEPIDDFLPPLERLFGSLMSQVYASPPIKGDGALILGCPVWGNKYIDRFQNYCLPSMVSEANLQALAGRCHMVLFTDTDSFARLWGLTKTMEKHGITLQILLISQEVMQFINPRDPKSLDKYWLLGVCSNVHMQMCGRMGGNFHALHPDHIYARDYFPNLFRLAKDHEVIAQPGISANILTAAPDIEKHRDERGLLAISDRDLGTIGWKHLHRQTKACLMNDAQIPDKMPHSHLMVWQGRDKLVLHCCHMNPAFLSARLCEQAMPRIPATVDAELPAFTQHGPFYVPSIDDGMTYLEVSDDDKAGEKEFVPFELFSERWWSHVRFSYDWMPYSKVGAEVPIDPQESYIEDAEIVRQFNMILDNLIRDNPPGAAQRYIAKSAFRHA